MRSAATFPHPCTSTVRECTVRTHLAKVEERRQWSHVQLARGGLAKLIEEHVRARLQRCEAAVRRVLGKKSIMKDMYNDRHQNQYMNIGVSCLATNLEPSANEIDCFTRRWRPKYLQRTVLDASKLQKLKLYVQYLLRRMRLNLRKVELLVVRIHLLNLLARWRAEHFDDLDELVDARVAQKDRLPEQQSTTRLR